MSEMVSRSREQFGRLHQPGDQPWHVRVFARVVCHVLVRALVSAATMFEKICGQATTREKGVAGRIALTGTFFADNWVEAHVRPLANAANCEHVWVIADREFVPIEKVTYVCAPKWLRRVCGRVPARSLMFLYVALRYRPDVLGGFHLLFNGLLALATARLIGSRAMWFCVGGWAEFVGGGVHGGNHMFNKIARDDQSLERVLVSGIGRMDLILTMGTGAKEYLELCGIDSPIEVMSGGIDRTVFKPHDGEHSYDIVTVSRIAPVKRIDVFLKVIERVRQEYPDVRAVVVGDGVQLEEMIQLAERMGLEGAVEFVGRKKNVGQWLSKAKLFLLTSDSEGLTLALMEAMMSGLPAVVTDVGDLGDLVHDGQNGWMEPPGDVESLARRVKDILMDGGLWREMVVTARKSAECYDVETTSRRWEEILRRWGLVCGDAGLTTALPARSAVRSRRDLWQAASSGKVGGWSRCLSTIRPSVWLGRSFRKKLAFLEHAQWWSADETCAYQTKKTKQIIEWAYERAPFYRRLYREAGFEPGDMKSLDDLKKLPIIDAETVRENLRGLCASQRLGPEAQRISTGGTGGRPLHFYINAGRSEFEYSHLICSWQRAGYQLGTPMAVLRGGVVPVNERGMRYRYDPILRHHHYSVFHMSDNELHRYVEHIRSIGPCFLHVYPSAVMSLARFMERASVKAISNVRGIIAESEIVYPEQREYVEKVLGVRYFSCYGHSEKLVLATECEHSNEYHVWPTYGYVSLVDSEGHEITTPGKCGEVVGTGFVNTVMPLIRYRTGDYATYAGDRCEACGRHHIVLRSIEGHRTQEMLVAADGSEVSWTAINMHDDTFINVLQAQFMQNEPGEAVLKMVVADKFNESDKNRILSSLNRKLEGQMRITLKVVESIPLSERGKTVYVDQRIRNGLRNNTHKTQRTWPYSSNLTA